MVTFISDTGEKINIPTEWDDLYYKQAISLSECVSDNEIVKCITEKEIINPELILAQMDFLKIDCDIKNVKRIKKITIEDKTIDLKTMREYTWGQKIMFHIDLTNSSENIFKNIPKLISIYLEPEFTGLEFNYDRTIKFEEKIYKHNFIEVCGLFMYLYDQLQDILEQEQKIPSNKITPEQLEAGIDMFNQLGYFNSIDLVAGGDITKHEQVLKIQYSSIYLKLVKIGLNNIYEKKLREIYRLKNKQNDSRNN